METRKVMTSCGEVEVNAMFKYYVFVDGNLCGVAAEHYSYNIVRGIVKNTLQSVDVRWTWEEKKGNEGTPDEYTYMDFRIQYRFFKRK